MKTARNIFFASLLSSFAIFLYAPFAGADNALSVTVTPPLIQLTIGPGESWSSVLKIVNSNAYPVTYYAQVVDMEANGENGQSKFIPLIGPQDPALAASQLAGWMSIPSAPITVRAGTSGD